jgi:hypothetical protein
VNPNLSEPSLDKPKLRPHPEWSLKARRPFTRQGCHGSAKLDHNVCWGHSATRRTPALVGSSRKRPSLIGFARRCASDLALHRLVEGRSEQLKACRPSAGGTFLSQPFQPFEDVLSECHQIPRHHATSPFVPAPIAPVYLIRPLGIPPDLCSRRVPS